MDLNRNALVLPPKSSAPIAGPTGLAFEVIESADRMPDRLAGSVLLLGNFDGFHCGHACLLDAARRVANGAPIGIMSAEPHPRQLFAPGAEAFRVSSASTKLDAFARLGFAFAFVPRFTHTFAGQSATDFVERTLVRDLRVAHLIAGEDFRFGHRRAGDISLLRRIGGERGFGVTEVAMLHRQDAICSTSLIRQMLGMGDVTAAAAILGSPWTVEVTAGGGNANAVKLDWPADIIRPAPGEYTVQIRSPMAHASRTVAQLRIDRDGAHLRFNTSAGILAYGRLLIEFVASA